ncbi:MULTISPECIES: 4-hydroxy-tetrahydrodipicolinate synthase [Cetobacterium]|jgi:4-hydroxy-tetrahydrodipicolinate synthase|uniref:4-hydroxy-tetrahydrodipicolinate synthase n=1 Tax=Candidatus Cetobacterium colombiensis TaxID=3073100 RepID=A0ABU4WEU1_9FUSO|nr:4-hydroxy-tetrahydrodipicolinate synthase [Candidatus Cetobacterium colombiensis]MDX8337086.1 4-hydroxy-tetrahydrodipicolinate synthase [Candidatus Cetobacterium colombiensis]
MFKGSGVALITPFNEDMSVNYSKIVELVEYHCENNTDALIVLGTTGEASTLTENEKIKIVETVIEANKKRLPIIVGAGSNNTMQAIEMSKKYEEMGVDGLLLVTPYYNKGNEDGIYKHFISIAQFVKLPIMLYNVPGRTGVNLSISLLKKLSKQKNIVALKEASGDISYACEVARLVPELIMYSGNDDITIPLMSIGAVGTVSVLANIEPKVVHNMVYSYLNGDVNEAKRLQLKYNGLVKALFVEVNPVPVKQIMNILGKNVGPCRLPLGEMDKKNIEILMKELKEVGELN